MPYQGSNRLADLLLQRGNVSAQSALQKGQVWGDVARGLGSIPARMQAQRAEQQAAADQRRLLESNLATADVQRRAAEGQIARQGVEAKRDDEAYALAKKTQAVSDWLTGVAGSGDPAMQQTAYQQGRNALIEAGVLSEEDAPQFFPGQSWVKARMTQILPAAERFKQMFPEPKGPVTLSRDQVAIDPTTGAEIGRGLPSPPPQAPNPTEASLAAAAAAGDPQARKALEFIKAQRVGPTSPRAPIWVTGPDGQFIDLAGVAPPGTKPASTREQGRPVTSGDAGRLAELDTSIDDLAVLRQTVLPVDPQTGKPKEFGTTGTVAKVGAMLPNWATELTGWTDPKERQAVIDRVKQVIGKALEGGVLRKEDEYKYEKILPTIGDPAQVVETKLEGLETAIALRRDRQIDALEDAGYDVSRFRQRGGGGGPTVGEQRLINGVMGEWDGSAWVAVE